MFWLNSFASSKAISWVSCKHDNETAGSIQRGQFFDSLSRHWLLQSTALNHGHSFISSTAPAVRSNKLNKYGSHGTSMTYLFIKKKHIYIFKCTFYEHKNALKSGTLCRLSTATEPPQRFEWMEQREWRVLEAELCITSRKLVNCYKMTGQQHKCYYISSLAWRHTNSFTFFASLLYATTCELKQASPNDGPKSPSAHHNLTTLPSTHFLSVCS